MQLSNKMKTSIINYSLLTFEFNKCLTIFSFVDKFTRSRSVCIRIFGSCDVVKSERLKSMMKIIMSIVYFILYKLKYLSKYFDTEINYRNLYLGKTGTYCRCHWDNAAIFVSVNNVWKSCCKSFWLDPCPLLFPLPSSRHSTFGRSNGTIF